MAFGKEDDGIAGEIKGLERFLPVTRPRIVQEIERIPGGGDPEFEVEQAVRIDLVVEDGVTGSPLFHELGEDPRGVSLLPGVGETREEEIAHRSAPPVGNDPLAIKPDGFGVDRVVGLRPGVEDFQVLDAVAGQFGIGRHGLRCRATLADDEFVRAQVKRLVLAEVQEGPRAQDRNGITALVGFVEIGDEGGPLRRDRGSGVETLAAELFSARGHGYGVERRISKSRRGTARH